ncbi:hypothetical protein [Paenibacillus sp. XY044]|uniref:hypothetical protein n=1 Tax=Paenibacillus sp. XY044 TaxID=2026089 RepID=UPI00117F580D|nr:hypothetical protein [Paenibacillus sp. XY044]
MIKKMVLPALLLLSLCGGLTGCGMFQDSKSPEEWFSQTITGLAGKDSFSFIGQAAVRAQDQGQAQNFAYTGRLTGHDQLTMESVIPTQEAVNAKGLQARGITGKTVKVTNFRRQDGGWVRLSSEADPEDTSPSLTRFNPLQQLDGIHDLPKNIKVESSGARGTKVLRIELESSSAKSFLAKQLESEMEGLRKQPGYTRAQSREKQKLQSLWSQGDKQLRQMLNDAQVSTVYHLTINRKSGFPVRLTSESAIDYINLNGAKTRESMVNDVSFQP